LERIGTDMILIMIVCSLISYLTISEPFPKICHCHGRVLPLSSRVLPLIVRTGSLIILMLPSVTVNMHDMCMCRRHLFKLSDSQFISGVLFLFRLIMTSTENHLAVNECIGMIHRRGDCMYVCMYVPTVGM
jgi:hypothetical protein